MNVAAVIKPNGSKIGEIRLVGNMALEGAQPRCTQRLQGAVDAKPGEARHPRAASPGAATT